MHVVERFRNWWSSRRALSIVSRTVSCDERGITQSDWLGDREVEERLRWDEVDAGFAYKQDCFAFDRIYIALSDADGKVRVNVSEQDGGYEVLVNELPKHVMGFPLPDQWFERVAFPAFETNWTELYRREPGDSRPGESQH